jgi:hypothetical protein
MISSLKHFQLKFVFNFHAYEVQFIILNLMIIITLDELYILYDPQLYNFSLAPVTSSFLDPNILLSSWYSYVLNIISLIFDLCSCFCILSPRALP